MPHLQPRCIQSQGHRGNGRRSGHLLCRINLQIHSPPARKLAERGSDTEWCAVQVIVDVPFITWTVLERSQIWGHRLVIRVAPISPTRKSPVHALDYYQS